MQGQDEQGRAEPAAAWPPARSSLLVALAVTVAVTLVSRFAGEDYANTAVGGVFLAASWWLVLRRDTDAIAAHGLSLGGLTEPVALEPRRLARDFVIALGWAVAMALIFFPPFWIGYKLWWKVGGSFAFAVPKDFADRALGQLMVIALPEEAFFRGYLQSALDGRWAARRWRILGAELGPGWLLAAAIFAIGHVLTVAHPNRLGVFFPALLFGWLRARSGGIGAPLLFHAMCNLYSAWLAQGYGLGAG